MSVMKKSFNRVTANSADAVFGSLLANTVVTVGAMAALTGASVNMRTVAATVAATP